jgi:hypothetical protein
VTAALLVLAMVSLGCAGPGRDGQPAPPAADDAEPSTASPSPRPSITPRPSATPPPTATSPPARVRFQFSGVPQDEQALVRLGIEIGSRHIATVAGVRGPDVTVYAASNVAVLAAVFSLTPAGQLPGAADFGRRIQYGVAEANVGAVFVYTGAPLWRSFTSVQRVRAVVHEYMHTLQFHLLGRDLALKDLTTASVDMRPDGPTWLFEGAADLLSWRAMEAAGLTSLDNQLEQQRLALAASDLSPRHMETYIDYIAGGPDSIGMALLAADYLLQGRDAADIARYYTAVRDGLPWRLAFSSTFGVDIGAFYAAFDAYQRNGYER